MAEPVNAITIIADLISIPSSMLTKSKSVKPQTWPCLFQLRIVDYSFHNHKQTRILSLSRFSKSTGQLLQSKNQTRLILLQAAFHNLQAKPNRALLVISTAPSHKKSVITKTNKGNTYTTISWYLYF
jgi:hypothetical protein